MTRQFEDNLAIIALAGSVTKRQGRGFTPHIIDFFPTPKLASLCGISLPIGLDLTIKTTHRLQDEPDIAIGLGLKVLHDRSAHFYLHLTAFTYSATLT